MANLQSGDVSVLLGNGDGSFATETRYAAGSVPRSVAIGDYDGDGRQDLAVANAGDDVSVLISHGDGTSLWVITHSADFARPFVNLLGDERALGEAFHITSGEANPWDVIFHAVAEALDVEPDIVHVPTDTLVRRRADWAGPLTTWGTDFMTGTSGVQSTSQVAGIF